MTSVTGTNKKRKATTYCCFLCVNSENRFIQTSFGKKINEKYTNFFKVKNNDKYFEKLS